MSVDQRGKLEETPFSYRSSKDGTVFLEYRGLLGRIEALEPLEVQLVLAKLTGNFKHGNER